VSARAGGIDVSDLKAVDVHVHVHASATGGSGHSERLAAMAAYFRTSEVPSLTATDVAAYYRQRQMACVGWSPKYFPPQLVQYANTLLKDRVLFGTDYPVITPERWMSDFDKLDVKAQVRPLILKENAVRLLGLGPHDVADPAPSSEH
jgi:Amidohydrolase